LYPLARAVCVCLAAARPARLLMLANSPPPVRLPAAARRRCRPPHGRHLVSVVSWLRGDVLGRVRWLDTSAVPVLCASRVHLLPWVPLTNQEGRAPALARRRRRRAGRRRRTIRGKLTAIESQARRGCPARERGEGENTYGNFDVVHQPDALPFFGSSPMTVERRRTRPSLGEHLRRLPTVVGPAGRQLQHLQAAAGGEKRLEAVAALADGQVGRPATSHKRS
jgi:hypothetical protein